MKENLLERIITAVPETLIVYDRDQVIVGAYNIALATQGKCNIEDLLGSSLCKHVEDASFPLHQASVFLNNCFQSVMETGTIEYFEYKECHSFHEVTVKKLGDDQIICMIRDISPLVTQLHRSQNEALLALTAGGMTSWSYDLDTKIFSSSHVNAVISAATPYDDLLNRMEPEGRQLVLESFERLASGESVHEQFLVQVEDLEGKTRWSDVEAVPDVIDKNGKVCVIVGSQKDVTQKVADEARNQENRVRLDMVTKSGNIKLWEYDVEKQEMILALNDPSNMEQIRFSDYVERVFPEDRKLLYDMHELVLNRKVNNGELTMRVLQDGQYRWIHVNATPMNLTGSSRVLRIVGLMSDVTDHIELETAIRLREKAEEANRLKTAFLANMSHEIRTPLNAIVGFSSLIAESDNKEEIADYIEIIQHNNELLLNLINDILDLSRIEAGRIELVMSSFSVNELLNKMAYSIQPKAKEGVKVCAELLEKDICIQTDCMRLSQVISNFLNNAIKFTNEGVIEVGCRSRTNDLYIYVRDTGTGISKEQIPIVFERFVKLDNFVQGTGLGLCICKTLVELLGGKIGVESELGVGSVFWLSIPKKEVVPADIDQTAEPITKSDDDFSAQAYTILVAEDNLSNYKLLEKVLKPYRLLHAWDGQEAVDLFHKEQPDLVLMDIQMPRMNGFKATELIRQVSMSVPIIAASASVLPEEQQYALANGFTDFIAKPVNIELIKALIRKHLNGY